MRTLASLSLAIVATGVLAASGSAHGVSAASPSRCATAWNKTSPTTQRTTLVAGHLASKAFVAGGSSSVCEIFFTLGNKHLIVAQGTLANGTVKAWKPLVTLTKSAMTVPSNAAVQTNGMLTFKG